MTTTIEPAAGRPAPEAELLTLAEVARLLSVCTKTVRSSGAPGLVRIGRAVRYNAAEVRRWVAAGCPATSEAVAGA